MPTRWRRPPPHSQIRSQPSYIALLAMRPMQADARRITGERPSSTAIQEALSGVVGRCLDENHWLFDYRSDLTDVLGGIVDTDLSRRVDSKGKVRDIMASVRKPMT